MRPRCHINTLTTSASEEHVGGRLQHSGDPWWLKEETAAEHQHAGQDLKQTAL